MKTSITSTCHYIFIHQEWSCVREVSGFLFKLLIGFNDSSQLLVSFVYLLKTPLKLRKCCVMVTHTLSPPPPLYFPLLITGNMICHLDEGKTVTALPVEPLLPQEESLVGPDEEEEEGGADPVAAPPPAPRRGPGGRGRRAKGRRHGAAANKHKGAKHKRRVLKVVLFVTCVHEESGFASASLDARCLVLTQSFITVKAKMLVIPLWLDFTTQGRHTHRKHNAHTAVTTLSPLLCHCRSVYLSVCVCQT